MEKFKIRCSAISQIMSEPRTKKAKEAGELGETAKTYCKEWLISKIYGRKKDISNKYMAKGLINEDEAIDFAARYLDLGFILKNEKYFENDFIKGTPDLIRDNEVIDIKCSYDVFSFPKFETKINPGYFMQLQGYMDLLGLDNARLVYVLTNTPAHLITSEARKKSFLMGGDIDEIEADLMFKMSYDDIEPKHRIKVFEIEKDQEVIDKIHSQVKKCRNYIKTLLNE